MQLKKPDARKSHMKQLLWKIFLLIPPAVALVAEALPYGAVLIFGEPAKDGTIERIQYLTSYFDPLNLGYANFGPPLTAFLTIALLLCGLALLFTDRAAVPMLFLGAFACAASLLPLLNGPNSFTSTGTAISVLLGAELVLAVVYRRFFSEKAKACYL